MMKLQECKTLADAQPILRGTTPTFRKTVETAFALMSNRDPSQQSLGQGFMATAIQELDAAEEPTPKESPGLKTKGDHFVKEELLAGGDKSGTDGSEQSTDNTEPYKQEGTEEPVGDLGAPEMATENQMKEGFGQPPMMGGQMPGPPGLDPQLAQQMAPSMPQIPPMNTPQQIQQMQYTVKKYMEAYVAPMRDQIIKQNRAIKSLATQVQETRTASLGLDLHNVRDKTHPVVRETMAKTVTNVIPGQTGPRIYEKHYNLEEAKQQIRDLDKLISNSSTPYQ